MIPGLSTTRRLPGVLCEVAAPADQRPPLRLDIAGFVGLAERGPTDVPVVIEDYSQYRQIFGDDLPLAHEGGRPIYAHLSRTVELFFSNGGTRCYVVRVAGPGRRNRFVIPGLLQERGSGAWDALTVPAAWIGRWSDLLSVATALRVMPLRIRTDSSTLSANGEALTGSPLQLPLWAPAPDALRPGDVLRLHVTGLYNERFVVYGRVGEVEQAGTLGGVSLAGSPLEVSLDPDATRVFLTHPLPLVPEEIAWLDGDRWVRLPLAPDDLVWREPEEIGAPYRLFLPLEAPLPLKEGALLNVRGDGGTARLFLKADRIGREIEPSASTLRMVVETTAPLKVLDTLDAGPYTIAGVERLSFDLYVREGEATQELWPDLRFGPAPPTPWDDRLQPEIDRSNVEPPAFRPDDFNTRSLRLGRAPLTELPPDEQPLLYPLGMGAAPRYVGPLYDMMPGGKDGLDTFDPQLLFLDPAFDNVGTRTLLQTANELLYVASRPRRLRGLHSLIPVDEVSLLAAPDLAQRGWQMLQPAPLEVEKPVEEKKEPQRGFHDCPATAPPDDDDGGGMPVVPLDPATAVPSPSSQAWLEDLPVHLAPTAYDEAPMLLVQRAMIRLCAARGDVVALLGLPQHYEQQGVGQWHDALAATPDFFDGDPLSYAAVYHGWMAIREPRTPELAPLRYLPPDGAVTGMAAARARARGAWVAPANVALRGVVDLKPHFGDEVWGSLYDKQINIVRHHPGRYTMMSALTLARDYTLQQISVRRLLIFLRKLALREGRRYVFESNDERFRSLVQTHFERILAQILDLGGLQAYQVVTDERMNTPNDVDNGRFLIALKVAPTLPIEYITITLLRTGADQIEILER